jgi:ABC-2 type transport system permease protein
MRPESDEGAYRLVARREFVERLHDRGFQISTAITLLILLGFIAATALFGGRTRFDLGVVGEGALTMGRQVVAEAERLNVAVTVHGYPTMAAAEAAVEDGTVDAAIVDDREVIVKSEPPVQGRQLLTMIQAVTARERAGAALQGAGLTQEQITSALNAEPLPIHELRPLDQRRREANAVVFVGVLALYGQLFAYGYWVAAGVVEEKSSRVVEVLLSTIRPSQLLRGKILGIGTLGLCQLLLIAAVGLAAARLAGILRFPVGAAAAIGWVLFWFVLGFFFYSTLFAVAGSIVSRQEDLQATMTPLSLLIIAAFVIGITALGSPDSTLALVASLLPPTAPLAMPSRIVLGQAPLWQPIASAIVSVGTTVALVPFAVRMYSRAVLRTGRVKIRELLRAEPRIPY